MTKTALAPAKAKVLRSDGTEARNRLLDAALPLFAERGFAKTSTREIAQAAQVNIASISYYFGDKHGLYRAVFMDERLNPTIDPRSFDSAAMGLEDSLRVLLCGFMEPLKQGELLQHCMKLHFREMLEPTGLWQEEVNGNIKPAHAALVALLCRQFGLPRADDDAHRLAFSITGLGVMLQIGHDVVADIRPKLIASHAALDLYCNRLVSYAIAMVEAEARRRASTSTAAAAAPTQRKKTT